MNINIRKETNKTTMSDVKRIWEAYLSIYEQAPAAPAPAPKPVAKPVAKSKPQVTDPSSGVDIDDKGRWQGQIIDQGKVLEPEKTDVTPGKKGPDPNLPAGEANPNKKRDDEIASAPQQGPLPPGPRGYRRPGSYDPNKFYWLGPGSVPSPNIPATGPGYSKKNGNGIQIAGSQSGPRGTGGKSAGDPANIKWPRDRPGGARPGPGYRPPLA